jgi:hypothetical protein
VGVKQKVGNVVRGLSPKRNSKRNSNPGSVAEEKEAAEEREDAERESRGHRQGRRATLSLKLQEMSTKIVGGLTTVQSSLLKIPDLSADTESGISVAEAAAAEAIASAAAERTTGKASPNLREQTIDERIHEIEVRRMPTAAIATGAPMLTPLLRSQGKADDLDHVPQILICSHTAKEIESCNKLHPVHLPAIHVKGKQEVIPISMIFSTKVGGRESYDGRIGSGRFGTVRPNIPRPGLAGFRYKSVTDGLFADTKDEPSSPQYAQYSRDGKASNVFGTGPDGGKLSLSLGDLYQDVVLSFPQFHMVLPMVLSGTAVDLPLEDMFWIRTGGVPQYVHQRRASTRAAERALVRSDRALKMRCITRRQLTRLHPQIRAQLRGRAGVCGPAVRGRDGQPQLRQPRLELRARDRLHGA